MTTVRLRDLLLQCRPNPVQLQPSSNTGATGKRGIQDQDSLPPDDRGNNPKKPRIASTTSSMSADCRFACPYYKRELKKMAEIEDIEDVSDGTTSVFPVSSEYLIPMWRPN